MKKDKNLLGNSVDKIKGILTGKSKDNNLDKVDDIINKISGKLLNADSINYMDQVRHTISSSILDYGKDFFKEMTGSNLYDWETRDRINRYINSQEIIDNIPHCASALNVIRDEIVSPDDITKQSIVILPKEGLEPSNSIEETDLSYIKSIRDELKVEDYIGDIIYDTLKDGDQFVEICDYTSKDIPVTQVILTEQKNLTTEEKNFLSENTKVNIKHDLTEDGKIKTTNFDFTLEITVDKKIDSLDVDISDRKKRQNERQKEKEVPLKNVRLIVHDASYIIKIQSDRYKLCLGYLVLPKYGDISGTLVRNIYSKPANSIFSASINGALPGGSSNTNFTGIDIVYEKLISTLKKYINADDIKINKKEAIDILKRVITEVEETKLDKLKIRFVPSENMQHFFLSDSRFFPYGESIFFKSFFAAKLLMLQEVAVTMKRIIESQERRVYYIESGLPRQVRNLIESLKQSLKKRKVGIDTYGSISSIPSTMTSYEDLILPQSKGKRFVEIESVPPTVSARDATDELKYFRDLLVSSLGIPPSFVGVEENISGNNRNLTHQSIMFARTIIIKQKIFSKHVKSLFEKIYLLTKKKSMPDVTFSFPPPKFLQAEMSAEHINTVNNIVQTLTEMDIPKEYSIKKYLSFDWEGVENYKAVHKLDQQLEGKPLEGNNPQELPNQF